MIEQLNNGYMIKTNRWILILCLMTSCITLDPSMIGKSKEERKELRKERKAGRLIKRALKLDSDLLKKDTLIVNDTTILPGFKVDTIIDWFTPINDTIIIEKEKLKIQIIGHEGRLHISGEVQTDTVYTQTEVYVERIEYQDITIKSLTKKWWGKTLIGVIIILILALLYEILLRNKRD